jgi:hypothetical protein
MFTGNSCTAEILVNLLVHFFHIKVITPLCSLVLKLSRFLLPDLMTVSSQKVPPITLPQLDSTFHLIGMAVLGFPINKLLLSGFPFNERVGKF